MAMIDDSALREHLAKLLAWEDAHVGFDKAVHGIPAALRGKRPAKLPYSPWQLVEHLRITQRDILEFCRNPDYQELKWPDDYWPAAAAPSSSRKWAESIRQFRSDRELLQQLASDRSNRSGGSYSAREWPDVSSRDPAGGGPRGLSRR